MVDTAVILAGGLGTRLRSVVPDLPKPMAPLHGKPFLASLMEYWIGQDIKRFVLSVGYRSQTIIDYFGYSFNGINIDYVVETTPLGTGGGLLLANQRLNTTSPYILINGDTYFAVDVKNLNHLAKTVDADWCFSLFKTSEDGRYLGMEVGENGHRHSLCSKHQSGQRLANGGVYYVNPRSFLSLDLSLEKPISLEEEIFPSLLSQGQKLFGLAFNEKFIDIGVPEDYQRAAELIS
jgi:D-glycero-alpha-D-manno-heptose 1-phosphate guanylyltransferase